MSKRTLGAVVKEARDEARMTQRDLAAAVGIKASHVAYIKNGHRRPSIRLINRLSKTLGLDAKELLVLAHPEVKQIVYGPQPSTKKSDAAWPRFVSNQALLKRHAICPPQKFRRDLKRARLLPIRRAGTKTIRTLSRNAKPDPAEPSMRHGLPSYCF